MLVILAVVISLATVPLASAQSDKPSEYELKAAFMFNFAKFIDWPDSSFANARAPFTICVIGREAASRMAACVRTYDTIGRYRGEEFLSIVPSADEQGTLALAERMRRALESEPFVTESGRLQITASFGVAVSNKDASRNGQVLLRLADEALYRAKECGRNRSELATADSAVVAAPASAPGS